MVKIPCMLNCLKNISVCSNEISICRLIMELKLKSKFAQCLKDIVVLPWQGNKDSTRRKPSLNSQFQDCHHCWKKKMLNLMNIKTARPRILCLASCPTYNYQCVIVSCYCYFHCQVSCACFLC